MARPSRVPAPEQLRLRLEELGWSQSDLASDLGVADSVISRLLSGERSPSLELAFRIERSKVAMPAETWVDSPATTAA